MREALIIKEKRVSGLKPERMQRRMAKKLATIARKANKVSFPERITVSRVEDEAPPSMEELRIKAKELNIAFNARTPEKKLLDRITIELSKKD